MRPEQASSGLFPWKRDDDDDDDDDECVCVCVNNGQEEEKNDIQKYQ
jgi:hypothetical protein